MGWINKTLNSLVNKSVAKAVNTDTFMPLNSYYDILGNYSSFDYSEYGDNKLINEGYASNTHLYAIINKLQNLSMNGKYKVMINTADGQEEDTESDLYQLLQQPNENQTFDEFLEAAMTMLPVTGDLFLYGASAIGFGNKIMDLSVIPSNITDVVVSNTSHDVLGYQTTLYGKTKTYNTEEIYHGKLYNPTISGLEGHRGMSPLQAAYASLDTDNQIFNAKRNFYKNNGTNGIISSGSDVAVLGPDEAKQLDEALKRRIGGSGKANSLTVTGSNVNYTAIGMAATSMQFLESGDVTLRDLCMVYGMDSKLFGDPKASTYNNQAEAAKGVWTNCIIPYNHRFVNYLNDFVTPGHSLADGKDYEIVYDTSHIEELQKDKKTEAEKNKIVTDTIVSVLSAPISDESKLATLVHTMGIEEDEAEELLDVKEETIGTGTADNTGGNVQVQSLNGAQVTSMVNIVGSVTRGEMPKESAIAILVASFGMTIEEAGKIINPINITNEPEQNTTEANQSNQGTDREAEEDNTEEQTQPNNN